MTEHRIISAVIGLGVVVVLVSFPEPLVIGFGIGLLEAVSFNLGKKAEQ